MAILERLCRERSKGMPGNTVPSLDPHPLGLPEDKGVCIVCFSLSYNQQGDWQERREKARKGGERRGREMGNSFWSVHSSFSLDFSTCHVPGTAMVQQCPRNRACPPESIGELGSGRAMQPDKSRWCRHTCSAPGLSAQQAGSSKVGCTTPQSFSERR